MSDEVAEQEKAKIGLGGSPNRPPVEEAMETDPAQEAMEAFEELGASTPPPASGVEGEEPSEKIPLPAGVTESAPENVKETLRPEVPEPSNDPPDVREQKQTDAKNEVDALDFLLGNRPPEEMYVDAVMYFGDVHGKLRFHFRVQDGDQILKRETEYGGGMGPFSQVDRFGLNAAIANDAVYMIEGKDGRQLLPEDQAWRAGHASGADAWKFHFRNQFATLDALVGEIRMASGFGQPNVGQAEKVKLANAVGNS